ncbi:MAG: type II secretion system F family protein [Candidatus Zixiibacteriota bacterium]|nr:MAG: type II secretion system F family protein [candidate division Zixibacteria bacterium]
MANKFKYTAVSKDGVRSSGIIEAENESRAASAISSSGLIPVRISKKSCADSGFKIMWKSRIDPEILAIFTRKLLTLNKAGIPILRSLDIIMSDISDSRLSSALKEIGQSIEGGNSLTEAFEKHTGFFPELFINAIRAGEESGSLDTMLSRASELIEREIRLKDNVKSAVRYPAYVLVTIGAAFLVVITFVVPKFAGFYTAYGAELPWATRLLININRLIAPNWPYLIIALPVLIFLFWRIKITGWGKRIIDYISLSFPILGKIMVKTIIARFCYILSTLLSAGLPLSQSLGVLRNSISNYYFSKVISEMGENLSGGSDIVSSMRASKYFSPMVVQMFSIGLETGSLESLLQESARHYDMEIEQDAKKLTSRIEPLLTAAVGVTVLILALAIFLPMWNMISIFRK